MSQQGEQRLKERKKEMVGKPKFISKFHEQFREEYKKLAEQQNARLVRAKKIID